MNRYVLWVFSAAGLGILSGCGSEPPPAKPPLPVVSVAIPVAKEVIDYEDFTGSTDAVSKVEIRARVSGYLIKVNFKDGDDTIKEGDLLYQIDPRPFQADLDQANGNVERLEAEKKLLAIQVDRYRKLATKGAGSQQDLDQYLAQQAENVGALKSAHAQVDRAKLNLGFTRITAPISGKIGRTLLTVGNLVNADSTQLTTLMSIDPMYAYFNVEEPTLLEVRKLLREGAIQSRSLGEVAVRMGLADDVEKGVPAARHARLHQQHGRSADRHDPTPRQVRKPLQPQEAAPAVARLLRPRPPGRGPAAQNAPRHEARDRHRPGRQVRLRPGRQKQGRLPASQIGNGLRRSPGDRRRPQTGPARGRQRPAAHPAGRRSQTPRGQNERRGSDQPLTTDHYCDLPLLH